MKTRRWIVAAMMVYIASLGEACDEARADAIVAPSAQTNVIGNSNNLSPFNPWAPTRVQQVYGSSEFASMGGPQYIDSIVFRSNQFGAVLQNITINLSTTNKAIDGLSPTFADNIGTNAAVVYQGTLPIFSTQSLDASHPPTFDMVINLQHPFLYDPSQGNLLLDITNPTPEKTVFSNASTPTLDAQEGTGDSTSRVLGYLGSMSTLNPYQVSDLSYGNPDSLGLITEFVTGGPDPLPQPGIPQIVPEPSTMAILLVAASGLWLRRKRVRDKANGPAPRQELNQ